MNLVIVALWRSLFGTSTVRAAVPPTEQPKAIRTVLRPSIPLAIESEAGRSVEWVPRPADYWQQRTEWVLQRLGNEWRATADADAWPDVRELLELLARTPDAVIRQLPAAARDALALCDNASLSRVQLAERLSVDPSLIQAVLRQANGAWFGAGLQPVLRVDAAIDRIGIAGTRAVVLSACVDGLLAKPGGVYDSMVGDIWSHMVQSAPLARALAPAFGADSEEAFSIAMLHDIGKLVFFDQVSALRKSQRRPVNLPDAWLARALEQLHEPLGAAAAHQWGLGSAAADAIGSHHRRERPSARHPLAEALFVAERAEHARRCRTAFDYDGIWSLGELTGEKSVCLGILGRQLRNAA